MAVHKSPISILQERSMGLGKPLPDYHITQDGPGFKCVVMVDGINATGVGDNKKTAKQNAAEKAINMLNIRNDNKIVDLSTLEDTPIKIPTLNSIGKLNEMCSKFCRIYPTYDDCGFLNSMFIIKCILLQHETIGRGKTKKEAKQEAAAKMLNKVKVEDLEQFSIQDNEDYKYSTTCNKTVIATFKELSVANRKNTTTNTTITPNETNAKFIKNLDNNDFLFMHETTNVDVLKKIFRKLNVTFKISEFQKVPLILVLKTDSANGLPSCTFLHHGATYEETELFLLKKALDSICIILK
ncbi:hypothetical protein RN001_003588 [Aquatica leii]|uniref:DRBM domain-containing protein n=1 Tax=Aquatica leii TaxID=1421715 RepID=A0AAN7Q9P4_9COLE|nr:hypothetical protein RN001_003588 [Aquatica leii]